MKTKIPNALFVWQQIEDHLVPRLRLSFTDRAIYYHLLRHSRLEGKRRLRFSMGWLTRGALISDCAARFAVRRLISHGVLRLVERTKAGHLVEVRLPNEIPALLPDLRDARNHARQKCPVNLEEADFYKNRTLSQAIHTRECGRCFYCLRPTGARNRCLDHVVPHVRSGNNSYRNLVSCCLECNSLKSERSPADLLSMRYRDGLLTATQLTDRLHALDALAAGKLRPPLPS